MNKVKEKKRRNPQPDDLWKSISGFQTVGECIEVTGSADYYVSDGMWISPCGVSMERQIWCSCDICNNKGLESVG